MKTAFALLAGMLVIGPAIAFAQQTTGPDIRGNRYEDTQIQNGAATNPHQTHAAGSTVPGSNRPVNGNSGRTAMNRSADAGNR